MPRPTPRGGSIQPSIGSIGVATNSCCIGLRSGLTSNSRQAGEANETARLAALTIAEDQAWAFACRRAVAMRSQI